MCWEGNRRTGPRLRRCGLGRPRYGPLAPRAFRAGLAFLPLTTLVLAANVLSGRIAGWIRVRGTIMLGLASMIAGCAGMLVVQSDTPSTKIAAHQMLLGGGLGIVVPR
jgi:DHA2 family methylenomycin A resistance protein-like MFS transporter